MTEVKSAEAVWDDEVLEVTFHDEKGFVLFAAYIYPEKNKVMVSRYYKDSKENWDYEVLFDGEVPTLD